MVDEQAWQSLAERCNLIYLPRQQWQKARVVGHYRGYRVYLSTYTFGLEIILTSNGEIYLSIESTKPSIKKGFVYERRGGMGSLFYIMMDGGLLGEPYNTIHLIL